MLSKRTDLAVEAKELYEASAEKTTKLNGVIAKDYEREGFPVTAVEIIDEEGSRALSLPVGDYRTLNLGAFLPHEEALFSRALDCIAKELVTLFPQCDLSAPVLIAGLGNESITPDAIGGEALKNMLITRHLVSDMPDQFGAFRPVAAVATGVLGTTGIESAEIVRGAVDRVKPTFVIAIDAIVSRSTDRLCKSIQLSDAGIVPGSGVGNFRGALTKESLGVPVISVGIPTVVTAATLALDLLNKEDDGSNPLVSNTENLIVTPTNIDAMIAELGKIIGYAITLALQPNLTEKDLTALIC